MMRFEPALESSYRAQQFHGSLRYLRINLAILAVLILAIIGIDHVVMPEVRAALPNLARLGVMVPLLAIAFAVTFLRDAATWYPRVMPVLMTIALVGIIVIGLWAWEQGEPRIFIRLLLGTIAIYFVVGLPFRPAVAVNLLGVAFYAWAASARGMTSIELLHNLSMLLMTNVICAAGAFHLERARRRAWLDSNRLAETAMQDGLTGIPNRRRFDEHLQRAWQQGVREHKPLALLFADIDHFKKYNDRYGHQAGDEVMKAVAASLARFARRPLDLTARYGGEEFAVVLFDAAREHAARVGEEILADVRALGITHADSAGSLLTISVGIACVVPMARRSSAGIVQLADQALYAAKDGGRNQSRLLEAEYEHMKTGYFSREALKGDADPGGQ